MGAFIPPPPEGVEQWRGTTKIPGDDNVLWVVAITKTGTSYIPWRWFRDVWEVCSADDLTRTVFAAWALSAEARRGHATARATLLEVQREELDGKVQKKGDELQAMRDLAAVAHTALHEADAMLATLRVEASLTDPTKALVAATIRVIGRAHGALHRAGIEAKELPPEKAA